MVITVPKQSWDDDIKIMYLKKKPSDYGSRYTQDVIK